MPKLTQAKLKGLIKKPGRHGDGGGLYFRTIGDKKAYFVYRYRVGGKERETSLGPFPELTLADARVRHAEMRKRVVADGADPLALKRAAKSAPTVVPTFGDMADAYVKTHEGTWRNAKHRYQWRQTLTDYCGPIRMKPVNEIAIADVLAVLKPLWERARRRPRQGSGDASKPCSTPRRPTAHRRRQGQPSPLEGASGQAAGAAEEARRARTPQGDALRSFAGVRETLARL